MKTQKPILTPIDQPIDSCLYVKNDIAPYIDFPYHFHPEYELVLIEKGYGKRIVGDHIDNFTHGDLVFLSPRIPHVWKCDPGFYEPESELSTSCFVLHFKNDSLGNDFFNISDVSNLKVLFEQGKQGILLKGKLKKEVRRKLIRLYKTGGTERIILFLDILNSIANSEEKELLSGMKSNKQLSEIDNNRFLKIYNFLLDNFHRKIAIDEIASMLDLTTTSLCRYFKKVSGKSIIDFTNELRIKHACILLSTSKKTVLEICYEVGFNNLSNFNRQFKKFKEVSPSEYRMEKNS